MTEYQLREVTITYRPIELDSLDVMTIRDAADLLDVTISAVCGMIDRGDLAEVMNESAPKNQGRRLVLRREVSAWLLDRKPMGEITGKEAAALLGVGKSYISQVVKEGKLELTIEGVEKFKAARGTRRNRGS